MNPDMERKRFRQQFNDEQWLRLYANAEFMAAWDAGNFVRAGEIANPLIKGEVNTVRQLRRRLRTLEDTLFE